MYETISKYKNVFKKNILASNHENKEIQQKTERGNSICIYSTCYFEFSCYGFPYSKDKRESNFRKKVFTPYSYSYPYQSNNSYT